jgi:hypothetical protein
LQLVIDRGNATLKPSSAAAQAALKGRHPQRFLPFSLGGSGYGLGYAHTRFLSALTRSSNMRQSFPILQPTSFIPSGVSPCVFHGSRPIRFHRLILAV